jgi:hypothetical protein
MTKRSWLSPILVLVLGYMAGLPALAAVPVNDAAQLERRAETSGKTLELKSVLTQQNQKRAGVKCAVTTGKKGSVQNPSSEPNAATGSNAVRPYGPDLPAQPQQSATGGTLNEQTLGATAGKTVAGVDASQSGVAATGDAYRARSGETGRAQTVMQALDENSSIRVQNGMTWNQTMNAVNLWVQALNALNLAAQSDMSQGAGAVNPLTPPGPTPATCPTGYTGTGTASDPCRPPGCAATVTDGSCVIRRYVDANGNVLTYLARVQETYALQQGAGDTSTGSITTQIDALTSAARAAQSTR